MTPTPVPIGGSLPKPLYTPTAVQDMFRRAHAVVPKDERAAAIAKALCLGSVATGLSQYRLLVECIENRMHGAIERLLDMDRKRDMAMDRRDARARLMEQRSQLRR